MGSGPAPGHLLIALLGCQALSWRCSATAVTSPALLGCQQVQGGSGSSARRLGRRGQGALLLLQPYKLLHLFDYSLPSAAQVAKRWASPGPGFGAGEAGLVLLQGVVPPGQCLPMVPHEQAPLGRRWELSTISPEIHRA